MRPELLDSAAPESAAPESAAPESAAPESAAPETAPLHLHRVITEYARREPIAEVMAWILRSGLHKKMSKTAYDVLIYLWTLERSADNVVLVNKVGHAEQFIPRSSFGEGTAVLIEIGLLRKPTKCPISKKGLFLYPLVAPESGDESDKTGDLGAQVKRALTSGKTAVPDTPAPPDPNFGRAQDLRAQVPDTPVTSRIPELGARLTPENPGSSARETPVFPDFPLQCNSSSRGTATAFPLQCATRVEGSTDRGTFVVDSAERRLCRTALMQLGFDGGAASFLSNHKHCSKAQIQVSLQRLDYAMKTGTLKGTNSKTGEKYARPDLAFLRVAITTPYGPPPSDFDLTRAFGTLPEGEAFDKASEIMQERVTQARMKEAVQALAQKSDDWVNVQMQGLIRAAKDDFERSALMKLVHGDPRKCGKLLQAVYQELFPDDPDGRSNF